MKKNTSTLLLILEFNYKKGLEIYSHWLYFQDLSNIIIIVKADFVNIDIDNYYNAKERTKQTGMHNLFYATNFSYNDRKLKDTYYLHLYNNKIKFSSTIKIY